MKRFLPILVVVTIFGSGCGGKPSDTFTVIRTNKTINVESWSKPTKPKSDALCKQVGMGVSEKTEISAKTNVWFYDIFCTGT
jgi:hypothetical protein